MPKRRAFFKMSPDNSLKKSRNESDDIVIEVLHNSVHLDDSSGDDQLENFSSPEEVLPNGSTASSFTRDSRDQQRGGAKQSTSRSHSSATQGHSFSSSLDAALRRAAILERRAVCEDREEAAIQAAAAILKAEYDSDAIAAEEEAEAEAIAVAQAHEAARIARVGGGGGRRRLSELDVAEMMANGRLSEPQRIHMARDESHTMIEHNPDEHRRHRFSSQRSSIDFAPPMDIMPCPIYDVDVQLRKYVRTDGRQLSHTPVAMAARQNRQKRKEYVKKMEIAYANMQFETQYLRERMSRLQQELKWYKDRWAEHATKCPLLHTARRQPTAFKNSSPATGSRVVDEDSSSNVETLHV